MGLDKEFDWEDIVQGNGSYDTETITVDEIKGVTKKAVLVVVEEEEVFLAKSQIHDADESKMELEISSWLAKEHGWSL